MAKREQYINAHEVFAVPAAPTNNADLYVVGVRTRSYFAMMSIMYSARVLSIVGIRSDEKISFFGGFHCSVGQEIHALFFVAGSGM